MGLARVQPWDGTNGVSETAGENRVGQLRRERRMSQAAVAQCVGISRQSLNAIENGKCQPRLLVAYRLARLFQRPIENVFLLHGFEDSTAGRADSADPRVTAFSAGSKSIG